MKLIIIGLLTIFLFSCETANDETWEEKLDVTFEELKAKHEGTYQTIEEVWYKGEFGVLTFYLKLYEPERSYYDKDSHRLFLFGLVQTHDGILYQANANQSFIYTMTHSDQNGLALMNSEYASIGLDGNGKWVLIEKISDETPNQVDWSHTNCDAYICE